MNAFDVLRDSLYFFKRHLGSIVQLCLPLVIFEAALQQVVDHVTDPDSFSAAAGASRSVAARASRIASWVTAAPVDRCRRRTR